VDYSRVEVAADVVARREATAVILFKQKVEIATLTSVARNDIALLDANGFYPVARDDNLSKRNGRQICSPEGEKMPTLRKWGLSLSALILKKIGTVPF
jgi:hypothetical protein